MTTRLFSVVVLLAFTAAIGAADPALVRKLIEQLKSEQFSQREKATQELKNLEDVPEELRAAAKSDDLEVRRRAQAAVDAITARLDERAFKAMAADLQKVELDRFVRRMVTDNDFAGDQHWEIVHKLTNLVTAKANELSGRKLGVPDLAMKSLPQQNGVGQSVEIGKRILLSDPAAGMVVMRGSVLLSAGPTPRITHLDNSIVIVDGDFNGATLMQNCLLIVRGNVGRFTTLRNCVILATGEFQGATSCQDSFFQVGSKQLRFTSSRNNVYINSAPSNAGNDVNGQIHNTERGPLQMLKFSEATKQP